MPLSWGNETICPKRYCGHYVRVTVTWENILAGSLRYRFLSPALSVPIEKMIPIWFPCSFLYLHPGPACLYAGVLAACWLVSASPLLSGPEHMSELGICPLPPCPAGCPSAWPGWQLGVLSVSACLSVSGGQAPLLTTRSERNRWELSAQRTPLRLGRSPDSVVSALAGCISALRLGPFC